MIIRNQRACDFIEPPDAETWSESYRSLALPSRPLPALFTAPVGLSEHQLDVGDVDVSRHLDRFQHDAWEFRSPVSDTKLEGENASLLT